jgi:hypothetical protein
MKPDQRGDVPSKEGGGSYGEENARRYDAGVRENARGGKSDRQAREAAESLEGPEADELRRAEHEGKAAKEQPRR